MSKDACYTSYSIQVLHHVRQTALPVSVISWLVLMVKKQKILTTKQAVLLVADSIF